MTSTSSSQLAREVLDQCLAGSVPGELQRALIEDPGGQSLFGILAEGLADRFEIEHVAGRGGMGVVYRATDRLTGDPVAVKIVALARRRC